MRWMLLREKTYTEGFGPGPMHSSMTFALGKLARSDAAVKPEAGSGGNIIPGLRATTDVLQGLFVLLVLGAGE